MILQMTNSQLLASSCYVQTGMEGVLFCILTVAVLLHWIYTVTSGTTFLCMCHFRSAS